MPSRSSSTSAAGAGAADAWYPRRPVFDQLVDDRWTLPRAPDRRRRRSYVGPSSPRCIGGSGRASRSSRRCPRSLRARYHGAGHRHPGVTRVSSRPAPRMALKSAARRREVDCDGDWEVAGCICCLRSTGGIPTILLRRGVATDERLTRRRFAADKRSRHLALGDCNGRGAHPHGRTTTTRSSPTTC